MCETSTLSSDLLIFGFTWDALLLSFYTRLELLFSDTELGVLCERFELNPEGINGRVGVDELNLQLVRLFSCFCELLIASSRLSWSRPCAASSRYVCAFGLVEFRLAFRMLSFKNRSSCGGTLEAIDALDRGAPPAVLISGNKVRAQIDIRIE